MSSKSEKKACYPTKDEIINALKEEKVEKGFHQFLVILEINKKCENLCLIKGELLKNNDVVLKGKLAVLPEMSPIEVDWDIMEVGESQILGFTIEHKEETLFDIIREGIKNCLRKGKIPYFHIK